mmetsp:Transcript_58662/g.138147  ORF Transcript_58662/g.138147 Transcript_58662/m.138147 type:complete len:202 (-) Transcript_58662:22-627(-)
MCFDDACWVKNSDGQTVHVGFTCVCFGIIVGIVLLAVFVPRYHTAQDRSAWEQKLGYITEVTYKETKSTDEYGTESSTFDVHGVLYYFPSSYFLPPKQDPASNSTGSVSVAFDCDNFDSKSKAHSWRVNATKEVWVDTDDSSKKATCDSPKTALKLAKAMIIVGSLLIGLCGGLPLLFAIIMLVVQLTKKVVRVVRYVEMK